MNMGRLMHWTCRHGAGCPRSAGTLGVLVCMFSLAMLGGCQLRPLVDPEYNTYVRIKVNTDNIRNVTTGIYNKDVAVPEIAPEVMHVLFYEPEGNSLVAESFVSESSTDEDGYTWISGYLSLVPGDYRMLAYNFGTESTTVDGYGNYETATAGSGTVSEQILSRYTSKAPGEIVVYEPDHLTVANLELESVPFHDGMHVIEAEATTVVETWYIQIKVEGLEYVSGAQAFLSGMHSGNVISQGDRVEEPQNTVYFSLQAGDDGGVPVICGIFNTFGRVPGAQNDLRLTFDIRTKDGRTVNAEYDITDLFSSRNALEHNWLLMEQTLTIDPPEYEPGEGGGFQPEVGDWEDEHHDILI